jgi:hypothetical protein
VFAGPIRFPFHVHNEVCVRTMRLAGLNEADLRQRALDDPSAMVMQPTYDHVFQPWSTGRLLDCIRRLRRLARADGTEAESAIAAALAASGELRDFARLHPKLCTHVCTPAVARDDELMQVVFKMIDVQAMMTRGDMTDATARAVVSDTALQAVMAKSERAGGTTGEGAKGADAASAPSSPSASPEAPPGDSLASPAASPTAHPSSPSGSPSVSPITLGMPLGTPRGGHATPLSDCDSIPCTPDPGHDADLRGPTHAPVSSRPTRLNARVPALTRAKSG